MKPNFVASECEDRIYARWEEAGAFKAGANSRAGSDSFCIMIPPPNVTGALHMGHAFNNTIQDILIRWHRMRGFDVLWQPGQDHAGIATQMVVERELERTGQPSRKELGREKFLERVWDWKEQSGGAIINQLKKLGASCDWSRNRFTMDKGFHDAVLQVFIELHLKGCIYRGKRLVNWDPRFETAISDLEVEQVETEGTMWRLRYPLENGESYRHPTRYDDNGTPTEFEERNYLVVATTRPETMLGDTGVAVHPDDPRYSHLVGKTVWLPLAGRSIPIVADSYADPTKGTGAVKITPAHDFNDWEVGRRTGLRAVNVMSRRATMYLRDNPEFLDGCDTSLDALALDGLDRYEARDRIVQLAKQQAWFDGEDRDTHMVPHGDRSKVAIEPYLTDQWFVDTNKIVEPAIEAVRSGRTRIYPEQYKKIYFNWLTNIEPWCISRQLWWGHQIPVWYDEEGNQYCAASEEEARELAGGKDITRDEDVLDTWFSSGLWPIGTLGWPEQTPELKRYFPTDVLVTGFDIIFFWVARMMMMQLAVVGDIPFHTIYVHALVRDEHGKKMSKSLGNVIDPLELIEKYGADAVRFTLSSMAVMGRDLRLAESRVAGYRNFVTKIWNAARYVDMNDCRVSDGFEPAEVELAVNKWIVSQLCQARESVDESLDNYRFSDAANRLYEFAWGTYCDWYVEFTKPLLNSDNSGVAEETSSTIAWVLEQTLKLLHPFMPFVTEELWDSLGNRDRMLIHADWPAFDSGSLGFENSDQELKWIIGLIEEIRSTRSQLRVPPGKRVPMIAQGLDENRKKAIRDNLDLVLRLGRISQFEESKIVPADAITLPVPGGIFCLHLADVIDLETERNRLLNACSTLRGEIETLESRLGNPGFRNNAPAHVVEKVQNQLAQKEIDLSVVENAKARFGC